MFDPVQLSQLIEHVFLVLEKQKSYSIVYDFSSSEITELEKHFTVKYSNNFGGKPRYILTAHA